MTDFKTLIKDLTPHQKLLTDYYEEDNQIFYMHLPSFFSMYNRHTGAAIAPNVLLEKLRAEPYYLEVKLARIKGSTIRCVLLSLDPTDQPPQELLDFLVGSSGKQVTNTGTCNCDSRTLFNFGCLCGGS